jgi:V/A-type H+-transporting ATPase subunit A
LETARLLREGFLQQSSFDKVDMYSSVEKQIRMLGLILHFHQKAQHVVKLGAPIATIHGLPVINTLIRMKLSVPNDDLSRLDAIQQEIDEQLLKLEADYR